MCVHPFISISYPLIVYKTCQGGRGTLAQHWVSSACSYKAGLFCSPIYPPIHSFNSPFIFNIFIYFFDCVMSSLLLAGFL